MHTPEEINKSESSKAENKPSIETRKNRAWGIGRQDKKINKIGIKYHQVNDTSVEIGRAHV